MKLDKLYKDLVNGANIDSEALKAAGAEDTISADNIYKCTCALGYVIISMLLKLKSSDNKQKYLDNLDGNKILFFDGTLSIKNRQVNESVLTEYKDYYEVISGINDENIEKVLLSYYKFYSLEPDEDDSLSDIYGSINADNKIIKALRSRFNSDIANRKKEILRRYDMLFRSGFEGLHRPYGLLVYSDEVGDAIAYTDSDLSLKYRTVDEPNGIDISTIEKISSIFKGYFGYELSTARTFDEIAVALHNGYIHNKKCLYFPYKLLEYAYGRRPIKERVIKNGSTEEDVGLKYSFSKNANDWEKYKINIIDRDISVIIDRALLLYCEKVLNLKEDSDNIFKTITENKGKISEYLHFIVKSFSTCVIMNEFKSVDGVFVSFRLRGSCSETKRIEINTLLKEVFGGNGGDIGAYIFSSLNERDENELGVYEYAHEFNHQLSNAMPLFAYRALEALKRKKDKVSYENLVLGQNLDGTILRNGTGDGAPVILNENLTHLIIAGSRSGKGVMTLNLLVGALNDKRSIIYLDNKPDMASILSLLSGGNNENGPVGFFMNGGYYGDDKQHQFYNGASFDINKWINPNHIPYEARELWGNDIIWGGTGKTGDYGDIFYMKALILVSSIIVAASMNNANEKFTADIGIKNNKKDGKSEGIFLVCDEISRLQDRFRGILGSVFNSYPISPSSFKKTTSDLLNCKEKELVGKLESFTLSCNSKNYYAMSFLKHLCESYSTIAGIREAGLNRAKLKNFDIVIIGQEIDRKIMDLKSVSFSSIGYANTGKSKIYGAGDDGNSVLALQGNSFPLALTLLKETDALIGYNGEHPEYLKQTDSKSKAKGKLDLVANNFCYIRSFAKPFGVELSKQLNSIELANSATSIYFKPYLILNDSEGSADDENTYKGQAKDRVSSSGISWEEVIKEYPNDVQNPTDVDDRVGLPKYLEYMGVSNLRSRLIKGADVINTILEKYIGYPDDGSGRPLWLQYVTDLRLDWILTSKEIIGLCNGTLKLNKNNRYITEEYNIYKKFVEENPQLNIKDPGLVSGGKEINADDFSSSESSDKTDSYYCQTCGYKAFEPISMPCPNCGGNPLLSDGTWTCSNCGKYPISNALDTCPDCGALKSVAYDSGYEEQSDYGDTDESDGGVLDDSGYEEPSDYDDYETDDGVPEDYSDTYDGFGDTGDAGSEEIPSPTQPPVPIPVPAPTPTPVPNPTQMPTPFSHTEATTYQDTPDNSYTPEYDADILFKDDGKYHPFSGNAMERTMSNNIVEIIKEYFGDLSLVNTISIENGGHLLVNGVHINPTFNVDASSNNVPPYIVNRLGSGQWGEFLHGKDLLRFTNLSVLKIDGMNLVNKYCRELGVSDAFKLKAKIQRKTKLMEFYIDGRLVEETEREYIEDADRGSNFSEGVRNALGGIAGVGSALASACSTIHNSKIWNSGVGRFAKGVAAVGGVAVALPLLSGIITGLGFFGTLNLAIACAGGVYNVVRKRKSDNTGSRGSSFNNTGSRGSSFNNTGSSSSSGNGRRGKTK